jgi:hypothetical protein
MRGLQTGLDLQVENYTETSTATAYFITYQNFIIMMYVRLSEQILNQFTEFS